MTEFIESNPRGVGHPSDEELLRSLDAELPPEELQRIRAHVAECTACRAEVSAMKEALGVVQEFRDAQVSTLGAEQTAQIIEGFRSVLEQHAQKGQRADISVRKPRTRNYHWRSLGALWSYRVPILAGIVAFAVVLATTLTLHETTVSADTLLSRSEQRDISRLPADAPISRAILHIRVLSPVSGKEQAAEEFVLLSDTQAHEAHLEWASRQGRRNFWSSAGTEFWGTLSARAFGDYPVFDPALLHYMQQQDFFPDASASQFRKLIANRGGSETHVRKGEASYGLDYVFSENHPSGIRNAVLWVSKQNYDPFQLSIFTGNDASLMEYRISRESSIFEKRTSQDARLLSPAPNPSVPAAIPEPAHAPAMAPLKYAEISASPGEVRATELLHKLNACLGEEVYVYPMSDGSIVVQGLVESIERRKTLTNALMTDGSIRAQIFTPDQLRAGIHLFASPYADSSVSAASSDSLGDEQSADLSGRQMAFHDELVASFQSEGKTSDEAQRAVAAYSSELSALSQKVLLHAWAMERLDTEFSISRTAGLAKPELDTLRVLRQDHRQHIRELVRAELALLARIPVGEGLPRVQTTPSAEETLSLAKEQEKLVRALFTASRQNARKSEALTRLLQTLHGLEN